MSGPESVACGLRALQTGLVRLLRRREILFVKGAMAFLIPSRKFVGLLRLRGDVDAARPRLAPSGFRGERVESGIDGEQLAPLCFAALIALTFAAAGCEEKPGPTAPASGAKPASPSPSNTAAADNTSRVAGIPPDS